MQSCEYKDNFLSPPLTIRLLDSDQQASLSCEVRSPAAYWGHNWKAFFPTLHLLKDEKTPKSKEVKLLLTWELQSSK